jgi:hypothetical protein
MQPSPDGSPPTVPTTEKMVGAVDLGLIAGTIALVVSLALIRWVRARAGNLLADVEIVDSVVV